MEWKQREIKFRFWHNGSKHFIEDKYSQISADGQSVDCCGDAYNTYEEITLTQFTGLHDKNGKEIYEADIVKIPVFGIAIIEWNEAICAFQYAYHAFGRGAATGGRMTNTLYEFESEKKYEVIGNVFENPDLINQ